MRSNFLQRLGAHSWSDNLTVAHVVGVLDNALEVRVHRSSPPRMVSLSPPIFRQYVSWLKTSSVGITSARSKAHPCAVLAAKLALSVMYR